MKDTLLFILQQIVDEPSAASVEETSDEGRTILTIHVAPADIGKIIGKGGRIIRAIRDLVKVIAVKHNQFVDVTIAEETTG